MDEFHIKLQQLYALLSKYELNCNLNQNELLNQVLTVKQDLIALSPLLPITLKTSSNYLDIIKLITHERSKQKISFPLKMVLSKLEFEKDAYLKELQVLKQELLIHLKFRNQLKVS